MPSQTVDVIVLGAGIVGVSAALHAAGARARRSRSSIASARRRARRASATPASSRARRSSPTCFRATLAEIARAALNRDPRAQIRYGALPSIAPALWRYFLASTAGRPGETAPAMARAGRRSERRAPQARRGGGRRRAAARDRLDQGLAQRARRGAVHEEIEELKPYGVAAGLLDRAALGALEPHVGERRARRRAFRRPADDARPAGR